MNGLVRATLSACLALVLLAGCEVTVEPTVAGRVGQFCQVWLEWERGCFAYEGELGSFQDAYVTCMAGMCGPYSGRDCAAEPVGWTQELVDACLAEIEANKETCSVFGDTFVPPSCTELAAFKE